MKRNDPLSVHILIFLALLTLFCGCAASPIVTEAIYPANWPALKKAGKCMDLSGTYSYSGKGAENNPGNEFSARREIGINAFLNLVDLGRLRPQPEMLLLTFRDADNSLVFRFLKNAETVYEYRLPNDKTGVSCDRGTIIFRTTPRSFGGDGINIKEAVHETTLQSADNGDLVVQDYKRYTISELLLFREERIERAWLLFRKMQSP